MSPLPGVAIAPPPASAPPRTSEPDSRLTYDPGDAFTYEKRRKGPAYDAMSAGLAAAAADARVEFEVGHSYWGDRKHGAGAEDLTTQLCPGCSETGCGVKVAVSKARGGGRSCSRAASAPPSGR